MHLARTVCRTDVLGNAGGQVSRGSILVVQMLHFAGLKTGAVFGPKMVPLFASPIKIE